MAQTQAERQAEYRATIARTTVLTGHTSPETAYVVDDYPYGFRLRCSIRYWLEYKKGHGFRLVSQTTNPKKPGTVWNKPKAGTYHAFAVMVLNDEGHVTIHAIENHYFPALTDDHKRALRYIRATNKASEVITVTVGPANDGPRQTEEEKQAILRSALAYGYALTK
jgi:hypothetical protein